MNPDAAQAFQAFEHAGWERVAGEYSAAFGELTQQAVAPLLEAAGACPGAELLDVASGPGFVAEAAAKRGARVTGVDFSRAMVEQARRLNSHIEFREGNAEALDFPAGSFDAVVMNFGILHLARPDQAVSEAHRVLRPGGRYAFTAWAKFEEAVAFGIVRRAVETHGKLDVPIPPGPAFDRFSDLEECRRVLRAAGFGVPDARQVRAVWRLESPDALCEAFRRASVRTGALLLAQPPEAWKKIRAAILEGAVPYQSDGALKFPMPFVLASGRKPASGG